MSETSASASHLGPRLAACAGGAAASHGREAAPGRARAPSPCRGARARRARCPQLLGGHTNHNRDRRAGPRTAWAPLALPGLHERMPACARTRSPPETRRHAPGRRAGPREPRPGASAVNIRAFAWPGRPPDFGFSFGPLSSAEPGSPLTCGLGSNGISQRMKMGKLEAQATPGSPPCAALRAREPA